MNTIDELVNYCHEPEPAGALLLTGEWGCGKTHIIEHDLKRELSDYAVIRISLFGVSSADELRRNIKMEWILTYLNNKKLKNVGKIISKVKKQISKMDALPSVIKNIANIDETDFITVKNTICNKTFIMVFDDLERCRMNEADIFGVINEYCEKSIHTIIVANQEKLFLKQAQDKITGELQISSSENSNAKEGKRVEFSFDKPFYHDTNGISYSEIKEKIIQRTVKYIPDYEKIVGAVIEDGKYIDDDYKLFIQSHKDGLLELFAPDRNSFYDVIDEKSDIFNSKNVSSISKSPHNIRSLKCAINDFYQVYKVLQEHEFDNLDKWLYSFTAYVISYKAGLVNGGVYGKLFSDKEVKSLYPTFSNDYIFTTVKNWILYGVWNEGALLNEIKLLSERHEAKKPSDIIKTSRIVYIDENVIEQGFDDFLKELYSGSLSLDEYVLFVENSCWARECKYTFPSPVNWNYVFDGATRCIERYKKTLPDGQLLFYRIGKENRAHFTDEEWKVYELISDFALGGSVIFLKNRKLYMERISDGLYEAVSSTQNKVFDVFNEEMAIITAQAFSKDSNCNKIMFVDYFKNIWQLNVQSEHIRILDSLKGFEKLRELLYEQLVSLRDNNKAIAASHTERLIQSVDEIIELCNEQVKLESRQNHQQTL